VTKDGIVTLQRTLHAAHVRTRATLRQVLTFLYRPAADANGPRYLVAWAATEKKKKSDKLHKSLLLKSTVTFCTRRNVCWLLFSNERRQISDEKAAINDRMCDKLGCSSALSNTIGLLLPTARTTFRLSIQLAFISLLKLPSRNRQSHLFCVVFTKMVIHLT